MGDETIDYRCPCGSAYQISEVHQRRLVLCSWCREFCLVPAETDRVARRPNLLRETSRLRVELATKRDWKELHEITGDEGNHAFEISEPDTPREMRRMLKAARYPAGFKKSSRLIFKATDKTLGKVVVHLPVSFPMALYSAYIGVVTHPLHHRKGYAREAMAAVVAMLFDELGVHKINAQCDSLNLRCIALLEAVGFIREGESKSWLHHHTRGWIDSPYFALFHPAETPYPANSNLA